jgi:hypothetical protein
MYKIEEITPGKSYGCMFKVVTMLDEFGRPPGLSDVPLKGPGEYEGFGILQSRDLENRMVELYDEKSRKMFVVSFDNIWDIDDIEWVDNEVEEVGC